MLWTFLEFLTAGNRGVITEWYEEMAVEAQQDFDDLLRYLAVTPRHLWKRPEFAAVDRWPGLWKFRWKANGIQYRPIGFFGPGSGQFTLLMGAEERNGKWVPKDAPKQASKRRKIVESDIERVRVYEY